MTGVVSAGGGAWLTGHDGLEEGDVALAGTAIGASDVIQ